MGGKRKVRVWAEGINTKKKKKTVIDAATHALIFLSYKAHKAYLLFHNRCRQQVA